jgi:hypothetical protein
MDSGATVSVVKSDVLSLLHHIQPTSCSEVATAEEGHSLRISGEGDLGPLSNVLLSDNIRQNCTSIPQLCNINYTVTFTKSNVHIYLYYRRQTRVDLVVCRVQCLRVSLVVCLVLFPRVIPVVCRVQCPRVSLVVCRVQCPRVSLVVCRVQCPRVSLVVCRVQCPRVSLVVCRVDWA